MSHARRWRDQTEFENCDKNMISNKARDVKYTYTVTSQTTLLTVNLELIDLEKGNGLIISKNNLFYNINGEKL